MKTVALTLGAVALALGSSHAQADEAITKAPGVLAWGGDLQGGEPYVFEAPEDPDRIQGFEVDIAHELGRRLAMTSRFVQSDWSNLVPGLERGDFDIILNGLEDMEERRQRILLSTPYFVFGLTLTVRSDSTISSVADLRHRRVGTINQTMAHAILNTSNVEVALYDGQQEPYMDLLHRRIDGVLLDHIIAERYACKDERLNCLPRDVAQGQYVIGVARDNPALLRAVNHALAQMRTDGALESILTSWGLWDTRQHRLQAIGTSAPRQPGNTSTRLRYSQVELLVRGAALTLLLSTLAFSLALPIGVAVAVIRLYSGKFAKACATAYVEVFRGTPLLLQLYFIYFGIAKYVQLTPITAAIVGLALNYGAYEAEVHRAGLLAIPQAQAEAARVLGLSNWQTLCHVLLPQEFRKVLPIVANDYIAMLKESSLVSVVTVVELTKRMTIVSAELRDWFIPGLLCAGLYLLMSLPLARLAKRLEGIIE
jgi:polar amino acid transport system substrate-binding protein